MSAPIDPRAFRQVLGQFCTGITIITTVHDGVPIGFACQSFAALSLDPPLVSICLGHAVSLIGTFREAKFFGINILSDEQQAVSERFARKGHDRFEGVSWTPGETGVPLISGALAGIECQVDQRVTAGDHDIFVGLMVATRVQDGAPLLHYSGAYRKLSL